MQIRRDANRRIVLEYWKTHPCVDCGETRPACLSFDHRDPALKSASVSVLVAKGASAKLLMAEIAKCDVRCLNCHAQKTSDQFGYYTSNPDFVPGYEPRWPREPKPSRPHRIAKRGKRAGKASRKGRHSLMSG